MLKRLEAEYRSQITFTSNMNELVTGNLKPGTPVRLSYDPQRIVPPGDPYVFGDPQRPVTAYVRFGTASPGLLVVLTSPGVTNAPDRDATGQGSMLKAKFDVPADAQMLSIWFSFTRLDGSVALDSDFGANFNFRFPEHDLWDLETDVVFDAAKNAGHFHLHLTTCPAVEGVAVRLGRVGEAQANARELPLHEVAAPDGGQCKVWVIDDVLVPPPSQAVTAFKVFYWIGGVRFKDDNTGHSYLSPPPPHEHVPPPPLELARAAMEWK